MKPFLVYLLRCSDGSYYAGQTDDMDARMHQHAAGQIGYTSSRKPLALVWQGEFETREAAIAFELQIKGWSRAKKEALARGDWDRVKELAKSHNTVRAELVEANIKELAKSHNSVRAEPVEAFLGLPQGSPDSPPPTVRAELVEANIKELAKSHNTVRAELVEAYSDPSTELRTGPSTSSGRTVGFEQLMAVGSPMAQRRAIAKSITLLESTRADHRAQADELLTALLPHTGKSFRLGISGVPGVGKSTFIEVLGLYLIGLGHRVAVLTIDPSSTVSGGSILGDKTRMEQLSVHERAYIRPSPSSGTLGGVAEKTREAMLVCEAAGYDVVIVETVGVGQSETAVAGMTDMFVLMQLPNAGDDLQAIKKGVVELADLVLINKADIDALAAQRAQLQMTSAMQLLGLFGPHDDAHWRPQALLLSALGGQGVEAFWAAALQFQKLQTANGNWQTRRQQQSLAWMWERIDAGLKQAFRQHPQVQALLPQLQAEVAAGRLPASTAARNLLLAQQIPA